MGLEILEGHRRASKEEIICEDDRDLELQLLSAVKVRADALMSRAFGSSHFRVESVYSETHFFLDSKGLDKNVPGKAEVTVIALSAFEANSKRQGVAVENESLKVQTSSAESMISEVELQIAQYRFAQFLNVC